MSDSVIHEFTFYNVGENNLFIKSTQTGCGCTIVKWSKDPVLPNDSAKIKVIFKPLFTGYIHKTIEIETNADSSFRQFYITGNVEK